MKTLKRIIRETWSTPPDAPTHSAYHVQMKKAAGPKMDFKTGSYTPKEETPKKIKTPTGEVVQSQTLSTADDYPAFDSREKAVDFMTRQLARVGNINTKVSPTTFNPEKEHAGAVVKLHTDGSYKWGVTNITNDSGKYGNAYKPDKDLPGEVTDALHNHPQSKHDSAQRSRDSYHSDADTSLPFKIANVQAAIRSGKSAKDTDTSMKYANPLDTDPEKRYRQELVYPDAKGKGWHASSYDAVRDKREAAPYDDNSDADAVLGAPKKLTKFVSKGEDMGDIKPEEPVAKAHPYKEYNDTAHDEHEFQYSGKELQAANIGRKLRESILARYL